MAWQGEPGIEARIRRTGNEVKAMEDEAADTMEAGGMSNVNTEPPWEEAWCQEARELASRDACPQGSIASREHKDPCCR